MKDGVSRICSESSAKLPKFLIPTIQENLVSGGSIKYGTFVLAVWCYYSDKRVDLNNNKIEIIDARKEELHRRAKQKDKLSFLGMPAIFGDLHNNERFVKNYSMMIEEIYNELSIQKLMAIISQDTNTMN